MLSRHLVRSLLNVEGFASEKLWPQALTVASDCGTGRLALAVASLSGWPLQAGQRADNGFDYAARKDP